jgi:hypothetical protein
MIELHSLGNGAPLRIAVEPNLPFRACSPALHGTLEERAMLMTSGDAFGGGASRVAPLDERSSTVSVPKRNEIYNNQANCTTCCIASTMCLVVLAVVVMVVVVYVRVEYLIDQGQTTIAPYLSAGLSNVARVLDNSAVMSDHAATMTEQGDTLISTSVPRLMAMLNQTQRLMGRFESFSTQPNINIGMG